MNFYRFGQYVFDEQWQKVRERAREDGVLIIGDIPMYVSEDSADVWADPRFFCLDGEGYGALYAGVPPDRFAADQKRFRRRVGWPKS